MAKPYFGQHILTSFVYGNSYCIQIRSWGTFHGYNTVIDWHNPPSRIHTATEVHIENCEGGSLPGVHSSAIRTLALEPVVPGFDFQRLPVLCFHFFHLITPNMVVLSDHGVSISSQGP